MKKGLVVATVATVLLLLLLLCNNVDNINGLPSVVDVKVREGKLNLYTVFRLAGNNYCFIEKNSTTTIETPTSTSYWSFTVTFNESVTSPGSSFLMQNISVGLTSAKSVDDYCYSHVELTHKSITTSLAEDLSFTALIPLQSTFDPHASLYSTVYQELGCFNNTRSVDQEGWNSHELVFALKTWDDGNSYYQFDPSFEEFCNSCAPILHVTVQGITTNIPLTNYHLSNVTSECNLDQLNTMYDFMVLYFNRVSVEKSTQENTLKNTAEFDAYVVEGQVFYNCIDTYYNRYLDSTYTTAYYPDTQVCFTESDNDPCCSYKPDECCSPRNVSIEIQVTTVPSEVQTRLISPPNVCRDPARIQGALFDYADDSNKKFIALIDYLVVIQQNQLGNTYWQECVHQLYSKVCLSSQDCKYGVCSSGFCSVPQNAYNLTIQCIYDNTPPPLIPYISASLNGTWSYDLLYNTAMQTYACYGYGPFKHYTVESNANGHISEEQCKSTENSICNYNAEIYWEEDCTSESIVSQLTPQFCSITPVDSKRQEWYYKELPSEYIVENCTGQICVKPCSYDTSYDNVTTVCGAIEINSITYAIAPTKECMDLACDYECSRCIPQQGYSVDDMSDGVCINVTTQQYCNESSTLYDIINVNSTQVVCLYNGISKANCNGGLTWFSCRGNGQLTTQQEFDSCPARSVNYNSAPHTEVISTGTFGSDYFQCTWTTGLQCRDQNECLNYGSCHDGEGYELFAQDDGENFGECLVGRDQLLISSDYSACPCDQIPSYYSQFEGSGNNDYHLINYNPPLDDYCIDLYLNREQCEQVNGTWRTPIYSADACNKDPLFQACGIYNAEDQTITKSSRNKAACDECQESPPYYHWIPIYSWTNNSWESYEGNILLNLNTQTREWTNVNEWIAATNFSQGSILFNYLSEATESQVVDYTIKYTSSNYYGALVLLMEAVCDCSNVTDTTDNDICKSFLSGYLTVPLSYSSLLAPEVPISTKDGSITVLSNNFATNLSTSDSTHSALQLIISRIFSHSIADTSNSTLDYNVVYPTSGPQSSTSPATIGSITGNGISINSSAPLQYIKISIPIRLDLLPKNISIEDLVANQLAFGTIGDDGKVHQVDSSDIFGDLTVTKDDNGNYNLGGTVDNNGKTNGIYFGVLLSGSNTQGEEDTQGRSVWVIVVAVVVPVVIVTVGFVLIVLLVAAAILKKKTRRRSSGVNF